MRVCVTMLICAMQRTRGLPKCGVLHKHGNVEKLNISSSERQQSTTDK